MQGIKEMQDLIPGLGRFPGEGNDNPFLYYCLENFMDRGAWWATVHGVSKELDMTEHEHFYQSLSSIYFEAKTTRDIPLSICSTFDNWTLEWNWTLKKEMATHSSILAWEIPWTQEPGELQSLGLSRAWHDLVTEQQHVVVKYYLG